VLGLAGSHCKFCSVDLNFRTHIEGVPK